MPDLDIGVFGARGIPSTYSGYETFLTSLLPALADRGHAVTMYCRQGEVPVESSYAGVRLRHQRAISTKSLSTLTHGLSATVAALRSRHDVLLVVNVANAPYCAIATRAGLPVILNTDGQEWLRGKWGRAARSWFLRSARIAGRAATGLVADGNAMRELYLEQFHADSTVIPYAYVGAPGETLGADLIAPYALTSRSYLITGGRMVPENNIDAIVARHVTHGADVPIVVVGAANYDSPVVRRLQTLAARDRRVRILGHVGSRETYFALLRHAARYLHGHSVGGTNPSLVEAMGSGARIAALGTPFNREVLGRHGEFFDDLETALDRYLRPPEDDDASVRSQLSARARAEYALADIVDAYERLLQAAAGARARSSLALPTRWSAASDGAVAG